jgi:hypothetical protein
MRTIGGYHDPSTRNPLDKSTACLAQQQAVCYAVTEHKGLQDANTALSLPSWCQANLRVLHRTPPVLCTRSICSCHTTPPLHCTCLLPRRCPTAVCCAKTKFNLDKSSSLGSTPWIAEELPASSSPHLLWLANPTSTAAPLQHLAGGTTDTPPKHRCIRPCSYAATSLVLLITVPWWRWWRELGLDVRQHPLWCAAAADPKRHLLA